MFTTKDYGKPISTKLSELLRRYITRTDRAEIAISSDVSVSLLSQVMYQSTTLTENSAPAMVKMIELAKKRATELVLATKEDIKFFKAL